jgi:hypothetical protein
MENEEQFRQDVHAVVDPMIDLLVRKQTDYGPHAINLSPGGALLGINVRMHDKMSRVANLISSGKGPEVADESVLDTYRDIANYAVIAVMYLEGTWPGSPHANPHVPVDNSDLI